MFWNKKAAGAITIPFGVLLLLGAMIAGVGWYTDWSFKSPASVADSSGVDLQLKEAQSCDGISSVNLLYNDKNAYKAGTDPGTNVTFYNPIKKLVLDDATSTTGPILTTLYGLAGNQEGTHGGEYFGKEIVLETVCSDVDIQTELYEAGSPTISLLQDDGVTKFTSSAQETVAASSTYNVEFVIKAPAEQCSSKYGAVFACEVDNTYIQNVDRGSGAITKQDVAMYLAHDTFNNSFVADQWYTFKYPGELCDGARTQFSLDYTTTSASPNDENQHQMRCHWLPINKDLNADTFDVITGIYDEDNNEIFIGNNTVTTYTTN